MIARCRQMEFEERPDYNYYIRTIKKIMVKCNIEEDGVYDWMVKKSGEL
jgi:hypothetical protein